MQGNYRMNAPVTLEQLEANDTLLWNKMKQYITDHAIDVDTRDAILARLNAIIGKQGGGSASYTILSEQCDYLDTFKRLLGTTLADMGISEYPMYDIIQWVSMIRMNQGVFGNFIYAIDENGYEHFYTLEEWEGLKQQLRDGEIDVLPDVVGGVINNSSGTWLVAYDPINTQEKWGGGGLSLPYTGSAEAMLRCLDTVYCKRFCHSNNVCIVYSTSEMDAVRAAGEWDDEDGHHLVAAETYFVVMTHEGERAAQDRDYINIETEDDPIWEAIIADDARIGLTYDCWTAQAYNNSGASLYKLPYLSGSGTSAMYGSPVALYCVRYKAFSDDDIIWNMPTQANLALLCANYNAQDALKVSVTGVHLPTGYAWSGAQGNASVAYYTSLPSGSSNLNSKTNAYAPVPFAAFKWKKA